MLEGTVSHLNKRIEWKDKINACISLGSMAKQILLVTAAAVGACDIPISVAASRSQYVHLYKVVL